MSITPTNLNGLNGARALLGGRTGKRRPFVSRDAQQLATAMFRADHLDAAAARVVHRVTTDPNSMLDGMETAAVNMAADARNHVDQLCLAADLYTHLEAAALLDGGDAA